MYLCNPDLNLTCRKNNCNKYGGPCRHTPDKTYTDDQSKQYEINPKTGEWEELAKNE